MSFPGVCRFFCRQILSLKFIFSCHPEGSRAKGFRKDTQGFATAFPDVAWNEKVLTYNSFALNARFQNEVARDAISVVVHRFEIPKRTLRNGFRRRVALLPPASDVLRESARPRIHRAPRRRCTLTQRIPGNRRRVRRAPGID